MHFSYYLNVKENKDCEKLPLFYLSPQAWEFRPTATSHASQIQVELTLFLVIRG